MTTHNTPATFHPAFAGRIGVARVDITPPVGIYARNWGAAKHDVADSIHRPLTLSALTLVSDARADPLVLISADLGWWRGQRVFESFYGQLLSRLSLDRSSLIFALTHTHSAAALVEPEATLPGCELVEAYRQHVLQSALEAVNRARDSARDATLDWHTGRCALAQVRDVPDPDADADRMLCGYNPEGRPDDTLVVGRVTGVGGQVLATLVNYACHPTTLAWENSAISPDYVGTLRETIETATDGAPALFLQGASGDLAPRYQYVGDSQVADRHGRQLGHAVLATLEDMEPPGSQLVLAGVVESGAPLAVWRHVQSVPSTQLQSRLTTVDLPLKPWPSAEQLEQQRRACDDRVTQERLRRKRDIRRALGDGPTFPLPLWTWQLGDALLVGSMAEAYSTLQQQLRQRFPARTVVCANLVNGSIGYLPPAELYDRDIYQVWQTPFDRGSLERVVEALAGSLDDLT